MSDDIGEYLIESNALARATELASRFESEVIRAAAWLAADRGNWSACKVPLIELCDIEEAAVVVMQSSETAVTQSKEPNRE